MLFVRCFDYVIKYFCDDFFCIHLKFNLYLNKIILLFYAAQYIKRLSLTIYRMVVLFIDVVNDV